MRSTATTDPNLQNYKLSSISGLSDPNKQSIRSADDKVLFQVQNHFVDDYQHYPNKEQRFIIKHDEH